MKKVILMMAMTMMVVIANAQDKTNLNYFVGSWNATLLTIDKTEAVITFEIKDGKLTGNMVSSSFYIPLEALTVKDNSVSFVTYDQSNNIEVPITIVFNTKDDTYKGTIMGQYTIEGSKIKK